MEVLKRFTVLKSCYLKICFRDVPHKIGKKNYRHSRYADNLECELDYDNKYWLENIKTHAIGLFVVGITIYMII